MTAKVIWDVVKAANLAQLLQATNRLAEAEPLMRWAVEVDLAFARDTGHQHPHLRAAVENYVGLLMSMGETKAIAAETVRALSASYGIGSARFSTDRDADTGAVTINAAVAFDHG